MKVQVERKDGDAWRQTRVQLKNSRNGNYWFKLDGSIYVFKDLDEGTEVVVKTEGGWARAGRVARGTVFVGEGKTYSESMEELARANPVWTKPIFA
jgi:hypothetical protein